MKCYKVMDLENGETICKHSDRAEAIKLFEEYNKSCGGEWEPYIVLTKTLTTEEFLNKREKKHGKNIISRNARTNSNRTNRSQEGTRRIPQSRLSNLLHLRKTSRVIIRK